MNNELTPMMNQYMNIKKEYGDAILFFRLGDFYEMFFEDARVASSLLGIALTSREGGKDTRVPMAGIPYHAADSYIDRLTKAGHKVAICEQVEDPGAARGIVRREIVRVVTPGTSLSPGLLGAKENNFLVSIAREVKGEIGFAIVDLSTGEFKLTQLDSIESLISELVRLNPAECLIPKTLEKDEHFIKKIGTRLPKAATFYDDWLFDYNTAYQALTSHFKVHTLAGFGCDDLKAGVGSAGALLHYLKDTQKNSLSHIVKLSVYSVTGFMIIDSSSRRNLELTRNMRGNTKDNTLLNVLDRTVTAMGGRLLLTWLHQPLTDEERINFRLEAVNELFHKGIVRNLLQDELKKFCDIERLVSRLSLQSAGGRELIMLKNSLLLIPRLKEILAEAESKYLKALRDGLKCMDGITSLIHEAIIDMPPNSIKEGGFIRAGYNKELDELKKFATSGKVWLAEFQKNEIERTGISSLKVRFNKVFGYYIEITKPNLHLVPDNYIRKQTLVNAERFITPELSEYEAKILSTDERIMGLEYELFMKLRALICENLSDVLDNAMLIAQLDVMVSLTDVAVRNDYTMPHVDGGNLIHIEDGRHPVLEQEGRGKYVPNDTLLDTDENQLLIITGPNMAGKSTYIRQVALIVLMAQIGSFVPARRAVIGLVDRIFTRVGASDDLASGMSTFMVEMSETANIVNNATPRSLIILDEIGRGTSTFDGLSLAWAIAEYINTNKTLRARTLFATHYHELTELGLTWRGIKNYNVAVKEWNDEVIFLYKLTCGGADHSYGIHVARLAGLPEIIIKRAREILSNLELNSLGSKGIHEPSIFDIKTGLENPGYPAKDMQEIPVTLIEELKDIDMDNITPLEALNKLHELKRKAGSKGFFYGQDKDITRGFGK